MKKFIVLDTEATNTGIENARDIAQGAQVYDLGYIVADASDAVYCERRFIISDVFCNVSLMESAYYADKIPAYHAALAAGEATMATLREAMNTLRTDIKEHNVDTVWAYNARFDRTALNSSVTTASNGWNTWALPYGVKWCDILQFARTTICDTKKYKKFCAENGYLTKTGRARHTADMVGKYLKNTDYQEQHTALQDARDELDILLACMRRKKKQPKRFN